MNIVYLLFASTFVAAAFSLHKEDDSKLVGSWTDGEIRVSVYAEKAESRYPHRLLLEADGNAIRKWGRWEAGSFYGAAIGTIPNSMSGESELVSTERPRGRMTCHTLIAHGVPADAELNYEMDFRQK
jgi:hypothetical protein